jgi:transforming growth factor-beta-induced protein
MKYLPWMSVMLVVGQSLLACSSDSDDADGGGGSSSMAGSAGQTGDAGAEASGGTNSGGAPAAELSDIVDTAVAAGSFTELAKALEAAGLVDALKGDGPFTVFAPTDAAFEAFEEENPGVLAGLSKDELTAVLTYHVVAGAAVKSTDLKDEQVFVTLGGSPLLVDTTGGVKVSESSVTAADVEATNGVIHVIDKIMLPPTKDIVEIAIEAGMFTKLAGALTAAELVEPLQGEGPFTVFAPTDDAFDKLAEVPSGDALKDVLLYHVVSGAVGSGDLKAGKVPTLLTDQSLTVSLSGGVKINDAKVTTANIIAKNGVIHVVDTVLVPE